MEKSDAFTNIFAALIKAQAAISNPSKDKEVSVHSARTNKTYSFKYATLAAIIDVIRGPLTDNGLWFTQTVIEDEKQNYRLRTTLIHESGEWLATDHPLYIAKGEDSNPAFGGAVTYMRRYSLSAFLGIAADDDEDDAAGAEAIVPAAPSIRDMIDRLDVDLNAARNAEELSAIWKAAMMDGRLAEIGEKAPKVHGKICEFYHSKHEALALAKNAEAAGTEATEATEAAEEEPGQEATGEGGDDDPVIEFPPSPPTTDEDAAGDEDNLPAAPSVEPETVIFKSAADILAEVEAALIDCSTPGEVQKLEAIFADDFGSLSKANMKPIDKAITARIDELAAKD